ncbi:hypothetical protein ACQPYE_17980 [Actinosynnema sp. CA-299493]
MSDRIIPPLVPGRVPRAAPGDSPPTTNRRTSPGGAGTPPAEPVKPRELDLRRTPPPGPGELPPIRLRHLRRYSTTVLDHKGRLTCSMLFDVLGWEAGTRIDIAVHAGTIVVRGGRGGEYELNSRRFLHIPSSVRRWCSLGERELVLVRAVPELSALLIFGQEKLDQALPDPRRVVDAARAVGVQVGGSDGHPSGQAVQAGTSVSRPAVGSAESGGARRG